jgi:hypothetical protein
LYDFIFSFILFLIIFFIAKSIWYGNSKLHKLNKLNKLQKNK